ncbi:hypothetical protein [Nitritalea halalkaliphila]|uniref:hypothetical protein n=1 Tax=Nitritalea halalkaliphila TaxID=590849 RepID=UPI001EE65148|nr:hypothetical protein [Nitritalea halalkaliphila]
MGFHVPGEMGGIWNHPIKLMDGFTMTAMADNGEYCLNEADEFINYPIGNKHIFRNQVPNFVITRAQFVPDGVEGMVVEYRMTNVSPEKRPILMEFTGYTDLRPVWLGEETGMLDAEDDLTFNRELQGGWEKIAKTLGMSFSEAISA